MQIDTFDELGISFRTRGRAKRKRRARQAVPVVAPNAVQPLPYIVPAAPYYPTMPAPAIPQNAASYAAPGAVPPMATSEGGEGGYFAEPIMPGLPAFVPTGYAASQDIPESAMAPAADGAPAMNWLIPAGLAALLLFGGF
jgi:hypothetical protein